MSNLTVAQLIGIIFAGACVLFFIFANLAGRGIISEFKDQYKLWYGFAFFLGLGALVIGLSKSPTKL